ncbi:hypothetical protein DVH02_17480 [Streptomyces corynorhini]|uniref:Flp pilus assembly protein RcpC/CpaB domain-containing protein n=1 Tax=Streptomyces corynorhini TaxID=2282652 RepID=A0A370B9T0_9ACTN|nr:hypothetical protein DVH02_17480 [Streptomyces corynorhini]
MPHFGPLRVRGSKRRLRRALLRRRRATAAGLAMTAAALAATGAGGAIGAAGAGDDTRAGTAAGAAPTGPPAGARRAQRPAGMVSAPVRIADAATVRLLRRGDRVDVIAGVGAEAEARVVAACARVDEIPGALESVPEAGALIVLSVPRDTAAALAAASATTRLAVTVC